MSVEVTSNIIVVVIKQEFLSQVYIDQPYKNIKYSNCKLSSPIIAMHMRYKHYAMQQHFSSFFISEMFTLENYFVQHFLSGYLESPLSITSGNALERSERAFNISHMKPPDKSRYWEIFEHWKLRKLTYYCGQRHCTTSRIFY